jgi:outer membrane receptor protein involved in Fe transport
VSHLDQQDITPVGHLDRLNISANVNIRLHDALESSTSIQRMGTRNAFPNEGFSGIHRLLTLIPPNVDVTEAWREDGSPVLWAPNLPHPEWQAANDYESSEVTRWMVSQRFAATILPSLTLSNRWGLDTYEDYRRRHDNERPWRTELGLPSGQTIQEVISRTQINNDLVLSLSPQPIGPGDITVSGLLGGNVFMSDRTHVQARGTDIIIPDWYNVANFATQEAFAMLPTQRRLVGAYGQAMLDYRGWGYLTLTGRNDWSSTLPKDRNSYFYPSASLGLVFTDALDLRPDWMPYGKVRASVAKVGNDAPPYSLTSRYSAAVSGGHPNGIQQFAGTINRLEFPFRGQGSYLQGTQLGNPDIRPESTVEYETGLEMRLLDNRARIDLSYYTKKTFDQIFTVPSSAATGYQSIVRNAGDLRNEGWEVSVLGRVLDRPGMSLDLRANWTRNRSSVVRLAEGVTNLNLAGFAQPSIRVVEGEPYGVIWGWPFMKNCVAETTDVCHPDQPVGALLIGDANTSSDLGGSAYGFPLRADEAGPLGPAFPNWLGNLGGELRFRNLSLSALVDIRNGGQVLNFQTQYQVLNGRSILTADRGESTVIEGINVNTGEPNSVEVVKDRRYYQLMYGIGRTENQIEPAGFVKLRQVSLSYQLPRDWLRAMTRIESASVHVTGRNLATWSDFSEGDPESDVFAGVSGAGQFFRFFTAPQTRGLTVGIRAAF